MSQACLGLVFLALCCAGAFAIEGVSFQASFDRWIIADKALGGRMPIKQIGGELADGKYGRALVLDGDSYIEFPAGASVPQGAQTVCLWLRPDDWGAKQYDNILGYSDTDLNALHLERSDPSGKLRIVLGGPQTTSGAQSRSMFSKTPLVNGEWVHIAVVLDPENALAELFLNGEPQARLEGPGPFPVSPPSILVGCGFGRLGRAVKGLIDDLVILDHAALPEEIKRAMAGVSGDAGATCVENSDLVAVVDAASGEVTVGSVVGGPDELIVGPGKPWARVGDADVVWQSFEPEGDAPATADTLGDARHLVYSSKDEESGLSLRYHVQVQTALPLVSLWAEVINDTAEAIRISQIGVLRTLPQGGVALSDPDQDCRVFLDTGGLMGSGAHDLYTPQAAHSARGAFVLCKPRGQWAASVSFVSFQTAAVSSTLRTSADGLPAQFEAACDYPNGYVLEPGQSLASEVLTFGIHSDGHEALAQWADMVMAVGELSPPRHCPSGWNSWYAYRLTITEDIVLANARIIADRFAPLGADTVQIDHGWQYKDIVGEWAPNERFPHGLPWLSEKLEAMGLSLGLWTAVSHVSEFAPQAVERPDTLFKGSEGDSFVASDHWYWAPHGRTFTLDPTHPDGEEQYRQIGAALRSYGCRYVKNDFQGNLLDSSAVPDDSAMTRGAPVYRKAMAAFREGMGPDMAYHICNGPLNVAAGLCDSAWVHGDVGNPGARWDWLRQWARDFAARAHVSGKFYWSDPDYLQVGQGAMDETRVRMAFVTLGSGPAFISDRLPELDEERLALISKCLPSLRQTARPVDLFTCDDYPHVWHVPVRTDWDQWHIVGLFNLDERPAKIDVDTADLGLEVGARYLVYDFFGQKPLGEIVRGDDMDLLLRISVPTTDVRIVRITRKQDRPFVLSTDMHLTQGAVELPEVSWNAREMTLSGTATRAPGMQGKIIVYVPEGYTPVEGEGQMRNRVLTVSLEFAAKTCAWSINFMAER